MRVKSVKSKGKEEKIIENFLPSKKTYIEKFPFLFAGKKSKISLLSLGGKKSRKTEIFSREENAIYTTYIYYRFPSLTVMGKVVVRQLTHDDLLPLSMT